MDKEKVIELIEASLTPIRNQLEGIEGDVAWLKRVTETLQYNEELHECSIYSIENKIEYIRDDINDIINNNK